jgi:hypothetical protein
VGDFYSQPLVPLFALDDLLVRTNSNDMRPTPLPTNHPALVQTVFSHNTAPLELTDFVKGLQDMCSDIQTCLKKPDAAFQRELTLYNMDQNPLDHDYPASRHPPISLSKGYGHLFNDARLLQ